MTDEQHGDHPPVMHGHGQARFCLNCGHELEEREVDGAMRPACESCGYIHYQDPKVAVGVLIGDEQGRVLLMQRAHHPRKDLWSYPSGFVDAGEKVEDAAIRETQEEVGVTVELDGLLGLHSETGNRVILVVYRGHIVDGEPRPGEESLAVDYFPADELPDMAFERDIKIIHDWHERFATSPAQSR